MRKRLVPNNKGSVLVMALWALMLLTVFAVQLGVSVRQKITLARRLDERDQLFYIAEAGIKKAIAELRKIEELLEVNTQINLWKDNAESFKDIPVGEGSFSVTCPAAGDDMDGQRYGLGDEGAKININHADTDIWERLLQMTSQMDEDDIQQLSYAIVDWRDKDSAYQHPQYGAEDKDYQKEDLPYEAKDGDFELIDELLLVRGMDWETFMRIKDFITVYGAGKININTASQTVLLALGLSEKLVEDILAFRQGVDMIEGTEDDVFFFSTDELASQISSVAALEARDGALLTELVDRGVFSVQSSYFRVRSVATLTSRKAKFEIVAILNHNGYVQYWREYF